MATGTILEFKTHPGMRDGFVAAFKRANVFMAASGVMGFRSAHLLVPNDHASDHVVVTARWDDEASYGRWLAHPDRETINAGLMAFVTELPSAVMYTIEDELSAM